MKSVKSLLTVVCFALLSNFVIAGDTPTSKKPETAQIQKYLSAIGFDEIGKSELKLNISFFINSQNEIIVVSTNNQEYDNIVKSTLNYKKIAISELEYNKMYTVPVLIK